MKFTKPSSGEFINNIHDIYGGRQLWWTPNYWQEVGPEFAAKVALANLDECLLNNGFWSPQVPSKINSLSDIYNSLALHDCTRMLERTDDILSSGNIEVFAPSLLRGVDGNARTITPEAIAEWCKALLHLCLYADRVWVPDPLEILARRIKGGPVSISNHEPLITCSIKTLLAADATLRSLQPLFDVGALTLYSSIALWDERVSKDLFGYRRDFSGDELKDAWPDGFVAEGMSFARHLKAAYTPFYAAEMSALEAAAAELSKAEMSVLGDGNRKLSKDTAVLTMLPYLELPYFESLSSTDLAKIRLNEESFNAFRTKMRILISGFSTGLSERDYSRDLQELEREILEPAFQALTEQVLRSKSLKSALSDASISLAAGALGTSLATNAIDERALIGVGITSLATLILQILKNQDKFEPAALTVYHLTRPSRLKRPVGRHWQL